MEEKEIKPIDVLQFSERDMWIYGIKIGCSVAASLIFMGMIYARFISVEATQTKMVLQLEKDKAEINKEIKLVLEKQGEDRKALYKFSSEKTKTLETQLEARVERLSSDIQRLEEKVERYNLEIYKRK